MIWEINRLSWHAKVYLWWYYKKFPYKKDPLFYKEKQSSNLCPYVRVVLLWAPLRWFFFDGRIKKRAPPVFILGPPLLFGVAKAIGYINYELKSCLIIVSLLTFIWVIVYGAVTLLVEAHRRYRLENYDDLVERNRQKEVERLLKELKKKKKKKKEGPTFWELLKERALATHDRLCPEITFKTYPPPNQSDPPKEQTYTKEYNI